jgi:hypothetical protein
MHAYMLKKACIHLYIHTNTYAYIHSRVHTYIHTYIHAYIHTYMHAYNGFERVNVTMSIRAISVVYRNIGAINLYDITL